MNIHLGPYDTSSVRYKKPHSLTQILGSARQHIGPTYPPTVPPSLPKERNGTQSISKDSHPHPHPKPHFIKSRYFFCVSCYFSTAMGPTITTAPMHRSNDTRPNVYSNTPHLPPRKMQGISKENATELQRKYM